LTKKNLPGNKQANRKELIKMNGTRALIKHLKTVNANINSFLESTKVFQWLYSKFDGESCSIHGKSGGLSWIGYNSFCNKCFWDELNTRWNKVYNPDGSKKQGEL
jgi:hypothetical protein